MDCKSNLLSSMISLLYNIFYDVDNLKCDACHNTYLLRFAQEVENFIHKRVFVIG